MNVLVLFMADHSAISELAPDDSEDRAAAPVCSVETLRAQQLPMLQALAELGMRLEDYGDALNATPIGALVARLCADLGVIPDWSLWDDQAWALEHLKASGPSDIGAERWERLEAAPTAAEPPNTSGPPPDSG